jgi:hypothetical protein
MNQDRYEEKQSWSILIYYRICLRSSEYETGMLTTTPRCVVPTLRVRTLPYEAEKKGEVNEET